MISSILYVAANTLPIYAAYKGYLHTPDLIYLYWLESLIIGFCYFLRYLLPPLYYNYEVKAGIKKSIQFVLGFLASWCLQGIFINELITSRFNGSTLGQGENQSILLFCFIVLTLLHTYFWLEKIYVNKISKQESRDYGTGPEDLPLAIALHVFIVAFMPFFAFSQIAPTNTSVAIVFIVIKILFSAPRKKRGRMAGENPDPQ